VQYPCNTYVTSTSVVNTKAIKMNTSTSNLCTNKEKLLSFFLDNNLISQLNVEDKALIFSQIFIQENVQYSANEIKDLLCKEPINFGEFIAQRFSAPVF
jgi:hypothetical protein